MDGSLLLMLLKAFERLQIVESDINFTCLKCWRCRFESSTTQQYLSCFLWTIFKCELFCNASRNCKCFFLLLWCNLPKFGLRSLLPIQSIKQWSCCNNKQYLCSDWPCHLLLDMASVLFYWTSFSSLFTLDSRPSEQFFSRPSKTVFDCKPVFALMEWLPGNCHLTFALR